MRIRWRQNYSLGSLFIVVFSIVSYFSGVDPGFFIGGVHIVFFFAEYQLY